MQLAVALLGALATLLLASGQEVDKPFERTAVRQELLWQRPPHRLAAIDASLGLALAPLMSYSFLLPMTQLRAGRSYAGPRARLRRFVRALLSGSRPLKVGAVGGSITWGEGTSDKSRHAWFSVVSRFLVDSFPRANITCRNGAVPATPSAFMVMCLEHSVDPDVDLVFVEYLINDGLDERLFDSPVVRSMERLIRRLLRLPGRPAVVLMQTPFRHMTVETPDRRPFHETMEEAEGALALYYDVQTLSLRAALWRLAVTQAREGFRWRQLFVDHHPGDAGNHVMADLAMFLLQETALDLVLNPWGPEDEERLTESLPAPMYRDNEAPSSVTCAKDELFRRLVTSANGFEYVNDSPNPAKPKWGFAANVTGSTLTFRLDSRRAAGAPGSHVSLFVHHLRSYEGMGWARFSCASGCVCGAVEVDAHITERVSQTYQLRLDVTPAEACEVRVEVLERSSSGGHRFKVSGVVVAEEGAGVAALERLQGPGGGLSERNEIDTALVFTSNRTGTGSGTAG
ncbi:hypothetical protein HYH03_015477 [Edaphochlamys debaryana]|uniref:SGNH hydrolase-type esterase domain-containing protein n=1 Tax=Edaphochlamys debaryana TaxID=47281 RepID=A0A835XKH1_9CHLO|nr:hypothetical protein HYH03_015477 [Edaphochlamys debaryana]|eukprot:KAG2485763.1 hypothetical protein HYH03_015477 [Edaphochlamys debaryana]